MDGGRRASSVDDRESHQFKTDEDAEEDVDAVGAPSTEISDVDVFAFARVVVCHVALQGYVV